MNFTLFVVGLTLANICLIAAQEPGCQVEETTNCHTDKSEYDAEYAKMHACIVCKNGEEPFGYLYYGIKKKCIGKNTLFIGWIFTYRARQKQGVASALMEFFIQNIAKANGYKKIKLEVLDGRRNTAAVKTYEKFGFKWVDNKTMELKL